MSGKEYRTITDVKGPLVFLNKTEPVSYNEIAQLRLSDGSIKNGQVLDTSDDQVIVQVFEGTASVDRQTGVKFLGDVFKLPVSKGLIGRILMELVDQETGGQKLSPTIWLTSLERQSTLIPDKVQRLLSKQEYPRLMRVPL